MNIKSFESHLGFLIYDLARYYRIAFDKKMASYGLTRSQWFTLGYVYREEGISQTKLAELLGIGKGTVGGLIDRMETNEWVKRRPDPKDRRTNLVYLTKKSRAKVSEIMKLADQLIQDSVQSLGEKEKTILIDSLKIIKKNLINMNNN